jgi:hypothetical protein
LEWSISSVATNRTRKTAINDPSNASIVGSLVVVVLTNVKVVIAASGIEVVVDTVLLISVVVK